MTDPSIHFYLPAHRLSGKWTLKELELLATNPDTCGNLFWETWLTWTLQTYSRLKAIGYRCDLVSEIASDAITVAARCDLPFHLKPGPKQVFVSCAADSGFHPFAQLQVVQNGSQIGMMESSYYLPHWPQPGLKGRNGSRGTTFRNIGYFGHRDQLAPELKSERWVEFLKNNGLHWVPVFEDSDRKTDYSEIDAIVAIRGFSGASYDNKPASKLYNAWCAGVPAILGPESAYHAERTVDEDYLEASTLEELQLAIVRLKDDAFLRQKMMENARSRASEISFAGLTERWQTFLNEVALAEYASWCSRSLYSQRIFLCSRSFQVRIRGVTDRLRRLRMA